MDVQPTKSSETEGVIKSEPCDPLVDSLSHALDLDLSILRTGGIEEVDVECDLKPFPSEVTSLAPLAVPPAQQGFVCDLCHKSFRTNKLLGSHRRTHSVVRNHVCSICDKKFKRSTDLKYHMLYHTREQASTCPYCDKATEFVTALTLKRHIRRIHKDKLHLNHTEHQVSQENDVAEPDEDDCDPLVDPLDPDLDFDIPVPVATAAKKEDQDKTNGCGILEDVGIDYKPFPCEPEVTVPSSEPATATAILIPVSAILIPIILTQIPEIRSESDPDKPIIDSEFILPIPAGQQNFECEICHKFCKTKKYLRQHLLTHSDKRNHKILPPKKFVCDICKKLFRTSSNLKEHSVSHIKEHPFKCVTCGKSFKLQKRLNVHMLIHNGQKSFRCEICSKSFVLKSRLDLHLKCSMDCRRRRQVEAELANQNSETRQNKFLCEICLKSFTNKLHFGAHKRNHEMKRNHVCSVCGYKFKQHAHLKSHMLIHTKEQSSKCPYCEDTKEFTTIMLLNRHIKLKHAETS